MTAYCDGQLTRLEVNSHTGKNARMVINSLDPEQACASLEGIAEFAQDMADRIARSAGLRSPLESANDDAIQRARDERTIGRPLGFWRVQVNGRPWETVELIGTCPILGIAPRMIYEDRGGVLLSKIEPGVAWGDYIGATKLAQPAARVEALPPSHRDRAPAACAVSRSR